MSRTEVGRKALQAVHDRFLRHLIHMILLLISVSIMLGCEQTRSLIYLLLWTNLLSRDDMRIIEDLCYDSAIRYPASTCFGNVYGWQFGQGKQF